MRERKTTWGMGKPCKCGETDPAQFSATAAWCRKCQREAMRLHRLRKLGMTPDQHAELSRAQSGQCAICKADEKLFARALHIDHNHVTDQVRGLLCGRCNQLLGRVNDDPAILRAAADYLDRYNE